jgi:hypothetical protein
LKEFNLTKDSSGLFKTGEREQIWRKYCGFLDLSLPEFMEIQDYLLMEQIELVYGSLITKNLMPTKPKNISEFRQLVPLTTYDDYAVYLNEKNEDALVVKPYCWAHTSGRGGTHKWVPYTQRAFERLGISSIAVLILATASRKGEVNIARGTKLMQNLPPEPYYSGIGASAMSQQLELQIIPPIEYSKTETFQERTQSGFKMALRTGVDVLGSLTAVLVKMGERFTEGSGGMKFSWIMLHPRIMSRLIRAFLISKKERRPLLPKDLWPLKGLICYGMDTSIYKEQLVYYWGKEPLELYGGTEMGLVAVQSWTKKGMTFIPFSCLLEFIREEDWLKSRENPDYCPPTVLLDEVKEGERYEVVITNFHGMPLLRYRIGDLVKIVALKDEEAGIELPQMVFDSRADDIIDIAGFTRIDEKTIWQSIVNTGVKHEEWTIRKEYEQDKPILHLYIEIKEQIESKDLECLICDQLSSIDKDFKDLQDMLGTQPLRVTLLPAGSFQRYYEAKQKSGADLSHLKPPHMNASDQVIHELLYSNQG